MPPPVASQDVLGLLAPVLQAPAGDAAHRLLDDVAVHLRLADLALDMEPEDGLIWVYDPQHEGGTMAFTEYGIESLLKHYVPEVT